MTWIITKNDEIKCVTSVPYPAFIVKDMKAAGYKIKVEDRER